MAKVDKPEIGAEMYAVFEHLYSNKSATAEALFRRHTAAD